MFFPCPLNVLLQWTFQRGWPAAIGAPFSSEKVVGCKGFCEWAGGAKGATSGSASDGACRFPSSLNSSRPRSRAAAAAASATPGRAAATCANACAAQQLAGSWQADWPRLVAPRHRSDLIGVPQSSRSADPSPQVSRLLPRDPHVFCRLKACADKGRTRGRDFDAAETAFETLSASGVMLPIGSAIAFPLCSAAAAAPAMKHSRVVDAFWCYERPAAERCEVL